MSEAQTTDRVLYTAEAHVTGGRVQGHGRTSDGALEVELRSPKELGGEGGGTNPEQLFAIGFASCFESAVGAVARRRKLEAGRRRDRLQGDAASDRGARVQDCGRARRHAAVDRRRSSGGRVGSGRTQSLPILERDSEQHRSEADGQRGCGRGGLRRGIRSVAGFPCLRRGTL